ncbi:MAG: DEAD/DEAH box helicase [Elusimicrobiota bacterium]
MSNPLSDDLRGAYLDLLKADVERHLPGRAAAQVTPVTDATLRKLIAAASRLAFSSGAEERTIAYEIVTRMVEGMQERSQDLIMAVEHVLARLGNFPGRELLRQRYSQDADQRLSLLDLEALAREAENSVEGSPRILTDFQHDLYDAMAESRSVSVSAPTSAGKSFVLTLDIIRRIKADPAVSIVYVVPTRALIRQVMLRLIKDLHGADMRDVAVRCVPLPAKRETIKNGIVYVLTQERLMSLLHSDEGEPWITTLIIDEAQGIKDDARGILLQSAIDAVLARFPAVELCFASPLAKNPEYLLELFGRAQGGMHFIEEHSPVSQNCILVSEVKDKPKAARFELLADGGRMDLGERELDSQFNGPKFTRLAGFAKSITQKDSCTIIYADKPVFTERIAAALIADDVAPTELEREIAEFIDFLAEHIHAEYPLIEVLKHRVAFHYGMMPAIVRSRVEDLFEAGKLRFICCTSTLLQGVNLPARDIVIENPHRGSKRPMERGDFQNLAGRAGRLLQEFHGNVWCLRPGGWEVKSFEGERLQEISSAFENTLQDGGALIQRVIKGDAPRDSRDLAGAALGKLFSEFIKPGKSILESRYRTETNHLTLTQTVATCQAIAVTLPTGVFSRNATILPMRLQALYEFLRSQPDITQCMPILPHLQGSYRQIEWIFQAVERCLEAVTHSSYKYHAWVASRWIHDTPLKRMIEEKIVYQKQKDEFESVGKSIRELTETIETDLRYRYVKHLRAYNDVLAVALKDAGFPELVEKLHPLHLYLECGASDPVALNLISLGLSRTTALLLKRKVVGFSENPTPEECMNVLRGADLAALDLPGLCLRELRDLL